jgi:anti-anti-sigma regulatory factor
LLPPELGIWRAAGRNERKMHRAPDFETWAGRVPSHWRVIVLALSPLIHFDANAVLDLKAAITSMRRAGRHLVLSGVTPRQYRLLMDAQIEKVMDVENICPDLEYAVARGIDLVHHGLAPVAGEQ